MKDEYDVSSSAMAVGDAAAIQPPHSTFTVPDFRLESGQVLAEASLRYQTFGTALRADTRDNCLVVCHALTGNAALDTWWSGLLGPGLAFDTDRYFIVCCNILGSCYGSTSPASVNPTAAAASAEPGAPYGIDFPDVSVQDTVRLQLMLLRDELNVRSVKAVIGGSFGGMQALEFAVQTSSPLSSSSSSSSSSDSTADNSAHRAAVEVRSVVPMACGAQHSAWQIAISEVQRQCITRDPEWVKGNHFGATDGLAVARQLGMISYRTASAYQEKFGRQQQNGSGSEKNIDADASSSSTRSYGGGADWSVARYLDHQGRKFLQRFDPVTYVKLTQQMDSHDVARGRAGTVEEVLSRVTIPALVIGIDSDVLYPLPLQEHLARHLPNSTLRVVHSPDGHDGFLLAQDQVAKLVRDFLEQLD